MGVSVASLIAATRIDSGLRNNRFFSNDQIAEKLTDAYANLRDQMIIRFAFWFKKTFSFSLAGGVGGNILTLSSNVPDLEMIQYLNLLDASGNPSPVTMLSSVAERNQYAADFPFAVGNGFNGYVGRKYFPDGDDLEILPAQNSLGNYELVYTPQPQRLALPITQSVQISASDTPVNVAGNIGFEFANLDPVSFEAGSASLTVAWDTHGSPPNNNEFWNGTYYISGFLGSVFLTDILYPTHGFTNPGSGTVSFTYQPAGSISELPEALTPWAKYLQIQASIAIRTAQRKSVAALDLQRQVFEKRIVALTKQRSQGVMQAPITQTNYGSNFGGTFGNG